MCQCPHCQLSVSFLSNKTARLTQRCRNLNRSQHPQGSLESRGPSAGCAPALHRTLMCPPYHPRTPHRAQTCPHPHPTQRRCAPTPTPAHPMRTAQPRGLLGEIHTFSNSLCELLQDPGVHGQFNKPKPLKETQQQRARQRNPGSQTPCSSLHRLTLGIRNVSSSAQHSGH